MSKKPLTLDSEGKVTFMFRDGKRYIQWPTIDDAIYELSGAKFADVPEVVATLEKWKVLHPELVKAPRKCQHGAQPGPCLLCVRTVVGRLHERGK